MKIKNIILGNVHEENLALFMPQKELTCVPKHHPNTAARWGEYHDLGLHRCLRAWPGHRQGGENQLRQNNVRVAVHGQKMDDAAGR